MVLWALLLLLWVLLLLLLQWGCYIQVITRVFTNRAILDFERRDDDELGFRKNDIVTIVSQRDEHCWVGELR